MTCVIFGLVILSPLILLWTVLLMARFMWYAVPIIFKLLTFGVAFSAIRLERWYKGSSYDGYEQLRRNASNVTRVLHRRRRLIKSGNCIPAAIAWCSGLLRETEIALAASMKTEDTRSWRRCLAAARKGAVAIETLKPKQTGWFCLHMVDNNPLRAHAVAARFRRDGIAVVFDGGFRFEVPADQLRELINRDRRAFALYLSGDDSTNLCSCDADKHAGMPNNMDDEEDIFGFQATPQ